MNYFSATCAVSCSTENPNQSYIRYSRLRKERYVQSRPIEMRATILYLANHWTEFEMLLTPHRFLYLVMFSLLAFPSIPQFIAHFWQICPSLCTAPFLIQIPIEMRAAAKHAQPIMPLLPLFSFLSFWENKMEEQKRSSNPWIKGLRGFRVLSNKIWNDFFQKISYFC